jgi:hypothetical protein
VKTRLLACASGLALLVALGHFGAKPLMAQIRAALVKNVDEPGRTPYQSTASCSVDLIGECFANFATVPAGKRLIVQHLSGVMNCSTQRACLASYMRVGIQFQPFYGGDAAFLADSVRFR